MKKTIKTKIISFIGRQWKQLAATYVWLSDRYKGKVKIVTFPIGGGLLRGCFTIN